jgi:hypothetical protein
MKSMKSDKEPVIEITLPMLLINKEKTLIIFAYYKSQNCFSGLVVWIESGNKDYKLGYHCSGWNTKWFEPYSGTITLKNN